MAKEWYSTVPATAGSAQTQAASGSVGSRAWNGETITNWESGVATYVETNDDTTGLNYTSGGTSSSDVFGFTNVGSYSGLTVINTNGFDETVTTAFTTSNTGSNQTSISVWSTVSTEASVTETTTTGKTQTNTYTTGTNSTRTWSTVEGTDSGTSSVTMPHTTTSTSTQTNITTSTRTTTCASWATVSTALAISAPYWMATVVEAERGDWLWAVKTGNTKTGAQIISDVMDSFTSSVFAPYGATTAQTVWPLVASDWTGVVYSTAVLSVSTQSAVFNIVSQATLTATSMVLTCIPPASSSYTTTRNALTQTTSTFTFSGAGTSSPAFTSPGTTASEKLTVTSYVTTQTTVLLASANASGGDTGIYSTVATTTKLSTQTVTNTVEAGVYGTSEGVGGGVTLQGCSFKQVATAGLTFVGGFSLLTPISGRGIKLPWAIESTRGMFSNIGGVSNTIPWTTWAQAQRAAVTVPLPPLNFTTTTDGVTTWCLSWNSDGLFATAYTTGTVSTDLAPGTFVSCYNTTHSYNPTGDGPVTQSWFSAQSSLNTETSARYADAGFAAGGVLPVSGTGALVWKWPGVLNVGEGTSTSRSLVTAETVFTTSNSGALTWGQETAASISTGANTNTADAIAPWVRFNRNPSIIP